MRTCYHWHEHISGTSLVCLSVGLSGGPLVDNAFAFSEFSGRFLCFCPTARRIMVFPETLRLTAQEFHSIINVSMYQEGKESGWGMFQEGKERG